jgi:hypothetical protein
MSKKTYLFLAIALLIVLGVSLFRVLTPTSKHFERKPYPTTPKTTPKSTKPAKPSRETLSPKPTETQPPSSTSSENTSNLCKINVTVLKEKSKEPVESAEILLAEKTKGFTETKGFTDKQGQLLIGNIRKGEYRVEAKYGIFIGYEFVTLEEGQTKDISLAIPEGTATLRIFARGINNRPIKDVEVAVILLTYMGRIKTFQTDERGLCEVRGLPCGDYMIRVKRQTVEGICELSLKEDENREVAFTLEGSAELRGRVCTKDAPIPDIEISLMSYTSGSGIKAKQIFFKTKTDAGGNYILKDILNGKYSLVVRLYGDFFASEDIEIPEFGSVTKDFLIEDRNASLSGRVIDKTTGKPLGKVRLQIGFRFDIETNESGEFLVKWLRPGECEIRVWTKGYKPYNKYHKLNEWQNYITVELEPAKEEPVKVTEKPPKRCKVKGRVTTSDGKPLSNVAVGIVNGMSGTTKVTDKDGYFECEVTPGNYSLILRHSDYLSPKGIDINLEKDGETREVNINIPSGEATLSGRVTNDKGEPIKCWIFLALGTIEDSTPGKEPDEDGHYEFKNLPQGEYELMVQTFQPFGCYKKKASILPNEKEVIDLIIPSSGDSTLSGTIKTDNVIPSRSVSITAGTNYLDWEIEYLVYINDKGKYELKGIVAGDYSVRLYLLPAGYKRQLIDSANIKIDKGEKATRDFTLPFSCAISFKIRDSLSNDEMRTEPTIELRNTLDGRWVFVKGKGQGLIEWLVPPGSYELVVTCEGYQEYKEVLQIPSSGEIEKVVDLIKK